MEVLSGKLVHHFNFKIFIALAFEHIKKDKLDVRVMKCVFIGYPESVKAYKLC